MLAIFVGGLKSKGCMRVEKLGDIELRCQDCMEYMRGLEDNAFDLAIVDPPYRMRVRINPRRICVVMVVG